MEAKKDRKGGGSKLTRTQTVTVRLDPKLRYLAELAARKHRRTLSSFIEWAVEESLSNVVLKEVIPQSEEENVSLADEAENLWDVDEPDRFAKLALRYPEMLNHDEQRLWKLAREADFLWKGSRTIAGGKSWKIDEAHFQFSNFRLCWDDFNDVVSGDADESELVNRWAHKLTVQSGRKAARSSKKDG